MLSLSVGQKRSYTLQSAWKTVRVPPTPEIHFEVGTYLDWDSIPSLFQWYGTTPLLTLVYSLPFTPIGPLASCNWASPAVPPCLDPTVRLTCRLRACDLRDPNPSRGPRAARDIDGMQYTSRSYHRQTDAATFSSSTSSSSTLPGSGLRAEPDSLALFILPTLTSQDELKRRLVLCLQMCPSVFLSVAMAK